ncbi:hypothetical protein GCM10007320_56990 [Pseudorhodoferax aquiterrae]|uniref:Uncharacterized protein n=1 Tax=Pseudorhodoferax aquiterrae TaxID=747304 RepID=A0ABQ3GAZ3_9BURK|nr:hypothetical protein GCM10007320_56990 [Pseudorhodoferax aquiterrae]
MDGIGQLSAASTHVWGNADPEESARRKGLAHSGMRLRLRNGAMRGVEVVGFVHGCEDSRVGLAAGRAPGLRGGGGALLVSGP